MKILIIAYYFPPQNVIASLRPYSWAKFFYDNGHDITIATVPKNKHTNDLDYDISKFKIVEEDFNIPLKTVNNSINSKSNEKKQKVTLLETVYKSLKKFVFDFSAKTGILYGTRFPDLRMSWVDKSVKKLSSESFDVIISTGCPYIVHSIAYELKQKNKNTIWIMDWRDLWTKNSNVKGLKIFHGYESNLEKKYHDSCDFITTVSEGLADALRTITTKEIYVIYNGYNPDELNCLFQRSRKKNTKLTITYVGTIYKGFRDPEPLFKAIRELIDEDKLSELDIELIFAGQNADVFDLIQNYHLEKCYKYLGIVKREKSLELQYDSDVLLFLECEHKTKGILTGKLFEYLSLGRKVWAIGIENENSAGTLICESNIGVCLGNSIDKIKKEILSYFTEKEKENEVNMELISQFTRENQSKKLLNLIEEYRGGQYK